MQYRLRTLLILAAIVPPTFAASWTSAPYFFNLIGSMLMRLSGCCSG
jgi:hypothetical protein